MANFFSGLTRGNFRFPDAAINYGSSPLPSIPPGAAQFIRPDGQYGDGGSLLPGGLHNPYAFARSARISTQTQMAFPNRVQLIIPALYIPAPESDGLDMTDPILEHAISDGDLVFSFRMGLNMAGYGSHYYKAPYGHTAKAVQLINLATVNYILWGLQVGRLRKKSTRWTKFFKDLLEKKYAQHLNGSLTETKVWNFIKSYLRPFGIQHGGDQQGGMHQGDTNRIVTHGAVDYVSSFAIEGKLLHVNNLWRDYDVHENDDLILALRCMEVPRADIQFNLSSSVRSQRTERVSVSNKFYFLRPETLQYRSFSDIPYIHIGRSQKYCSLYSRGQDACCWDARIPVTPGAPLQLTFEPVFTDSDSMFYKSWDMNANDEHEEGSGTNDGDNENIYLTEEQKLFRDKELNEQNQSNVSTHKLVFTSASFFPSETSNISSLATDGSSSVPFSQTARTECAFSPVSPLLHQPQLKPPKSKKPRTSAGATASVLEMLSGAAAVSNETSKI